MFVCKFHDKPQKSTLAFFLWTFDTLPINGGELSAAPAWAPQLLHQWSSAAMPP